MADMRPLTAVYLDAGSTRAGARAGWAVFHRSTGEPVGWVQDDGTDPLTRRFPSARVFVTVPVKPGTLADMADALGTIEVTAPPQAVATVPSAPAGTVAPDGPDDALTDDVSGSDDPVDDDGTEQGQAVESEPALT